MGTCLSKKSVCATNSAVPLPNPLEKSKSETPPEKKKGEEQSVVKKEIFIIKHRTSHEIERQKSEDEKSEVKKAEDVAGDGEIGSSGDAFNAALGNNDGGVGGGAGVRTSSCTKEEVDAILIQCGRLSRSSSAGKAALSSGNGGRKYSGSKRSYDFDNETGKSDGNNGDDERENRRRERHRQSPGRRRTPSRERDRDPAAQPRSGSRERGGSGGGRRVSRSPGRRSESPITRANSEPNSNTSSRPGKMVSVPATVPSVAMDKTEPNTSIKRIQVKRNAGSPRARSPARTRAAAANDNPQPISLSRSNSRKAEISPYRRNPLTEIDTNIISQVPVQKPIVENRTNCTKPDNANCRKSPTVEEANKGPFVISENVAINVIPSSGQENPRSQIVTRTRSSRLSRDFDIVNNPDTVPNPNASSSSSSYTALLLEDIQNFHQKNSNPSAAFTLPPCVTKAQSILDAVAGLNVTTGSNLIIEQTNKIGDNKPSKPEIGRHSVMESKVVGNDDDLMEPSFHKYVTVRRGTDDLEEQQESSGSNSFAGSLQQQWASSSCWEPNSAESTDRWTSASSTRAMSKQNVGSESGEGGKRVTARKRDSDHQQNGLGCGRIGTRGPQVAAPAST